MLDTIREKLTAEPKESTIVGNLTPASVLFPLLYKDGELHILFTKRTQLVRAHKGQVSFPGGMCDPADETLLETALREAQEEVGLKRQDIEILGALDPIATTTSGFLVHSFVGLVPYPYPFRLNEREVAELIVVPFDFLVDAAHWHRRSSDLNNLPFHDYSISYGKHCIWGATARILMIFLERTGIEIQESLG